MNEYENNNLNLTNNSEQSMNAGIQLEGTFQNHTQIEDQFNNNVGTTSPSSQDNKNRKSPIIIFIILVVVIIIGIFIYLKVFNNKTNDNSTNNKEKTKEETNKKTNDKEMVKTDWKKLEFSIDGVKKQLPLTIDDLMKDLPDGWEYYRQSGNKKYETYKLTYYGSDKTLDSFILFWKNQETNMVYWISPAVDYVADGKRTGFETSGIKEGVTEKDLKKLEERQESIQPRHVFTT